MDHIGAGLLFAQQADDRFTGHWGAKQEALHIFAFHLAQQLRVDVLALQPALARSAAPRVALVSSMSSLQPLDQPLLEALLADDEPAALARAEELATDPATGNLIYAASKRAISRWVRREAIGPAWAGAGIPLNAVAPGIVKTPMTHDMLADPQYAAFMDMVVPMPLNGHMQPEVVAELLAFLVSAANSHVTGQVIYADGGAEVTLRPAAHF